MKYYWVIIKEQIRRWFWFISIGCVLHKRASDLFLFQLFLCWMSPLCVIRLLTCWTLLVIIWIIRYRNTNSSSTCSLTNTQTNKAVMCTLPRWVNSFSLCGRVWDDSGLTPSDADLVSPLRSTSCFSASSLKHATNNKPRRSHTSMFVILTSWFSFISRSTNVCFKHV